MQGSIHPPKAGITRQGCHLLELQLGNAQAGTERNSPLLDGEKQEGVAAREGNCGIYSKSVQIKLD